MEVIVYIATWVVSTVVPYVTQNAIRLAIYATYFTYSSIQAKKQAKAAKAALNEGRTFMFKQALALRQLIYGQIRTSGPIVFIDETGTDREYSHVIIALAAHQCEEITTVYLNETALTLDGSGNVTAPAKYVGFVRVKKHLGTAAQTADADLVSESPRWTTNHRLRGICYVYVRFKWSAEVFPSGRPNISALVKGKLVYDPRTTTTAYSANWALCLGDYLMDTEFGLSVALDQINDTAWQAAANVADENVTLADSTTEKRYTCNGQIGSDVAPGDAIEQITNAGAGFIGRIGGSWIIHAGAYRTPTITLDENDIRGPISIQTKVSRAEIFNGGKGVFISPDNDWQAADYPPVVNATYTTEDGGDRIWRDFEWPFTTSNATAQRLTKIALERMRQQIIVRMPCKLTAMQVQAGDNVQISIARMGWTAKVFEVESAKMVPVQQSSGMALGYDLVLRETASGVWDWANGEETAIDLAPNTNLPDPSDVAAPTSLLLASGSTEIYQQVDGTVIPRIKATWTFPSDVFVTSGGYIRIEFKRTADAVWIPWTLVRGDIVEEYITDVQDGIDYDVRIRSENTMRGVSAWVSDSITAGQKTSAPNAPTGVNCEPKLSPPLTAGLALLFAGRATWVASTSPDVSYYEIKITTTDSDAAVNYSYFFPQLENVNVGVTKENWIDFYLNFTTPVVGYLRVRAVDRSGNASAWASLGANVQSPTYVSIPTGNMVAQDSDGVEVSSIKTGQSGTPTPILTRHSAYFTKVLTGGAPSEEFNYSISGIGFTTSPDGGSVQINNTDLIAGYNKGSASSTSTNARIFVATTTGSNIAAGTYGFNIILEEN
jgi:hypothetical protein